MLHINQSPITTQYLFFKGSVISLCLSEFPTPEAQKNSLHLVFLPQDPLAYNSLTTHKILQHWVVLGRSLKHVEMDF